ncbi:MAG: FecR family protein [Flavobacteriaceae bacterium]|nr:FecR family protein [Flavobacteriaceae bacterium]
MKHQNDDTYLAKWLAGEMPENELQDFKKSSAYADYKFLIDVVDELEAPDYNQQKNFAATLDKIAKQQEKPVTKVRTLFPNWAYAAAASVVLFLGYTLFFQETTYTAELAEQTNFELPDGSEVLLNAGSEIAFNTFNWKNNRTLDLTGEAYFKVQKGSKFTVITKEGSVAVLGTQFTVNSRNDFYNVTCFEGKVKVSSGKLNHILTPGNAISIQNHIATPYTIVETKPSWTVQESSFNNVAIFHVVTELERQYNITVSGKENLQDAYFSGRFSHTNLQQALITIFDTMEIRYTFDANSNVRIQKY